jgi:hypothetical protein
MVISAERGVNRSAKATSKSRPSAARRRPIVPPATASIVLSVSSCRSSRTRPAPSAVRTASSRPRRTSRATSRFATLAQTISRTKPAVASSTTSVG